jgi:hypothetical protein
MRALGRCRLAIVALALGCRPATQIEEHTQTVPPTEVDPEVAPPGDVMKNATIPVQLTVSLEADDVRVRIENPTDEAVRVWDLGNSWGGDSWSLRVRVDEPEVTVPRVIEVAAKGEQEIRLTPSAREWTAGEDLSALRDANLLVQVVLEIARSPEADENDVATGRVTSAEMPSKPPHGWLFGVSD